jgi:hypothetical protein
VIDSVWLIVAGVAFLLVEAIYSRICAERVRQRYERRLNDSVMFRHLTARDIRVANIGGVLITVSAYQVFAFITRWFPTIPSPWYSLFLIFGLAVLIYGPIGTWRQIKDLDDEVNP